MPQTYRVDSRVRFNNRIYKILIRWGLAPKHSYILTVRGRKSGHSHSTPVSVVEENGNQWLVAPYGEMNWVSNALAAGQVTLTRGRDSETVSIVKAEPYESMGVLKKYLAQEPNTSPYLAAQGDSPLEVFEAEGTQHPVFCLNKDVNK